mmetsp:Transcript_20444/g.47318  ORF Transcript_20444/g.47318 Transcript_20444/m.47318 type:complete len:147 (+) Transcript_20444:98-538(+)|eukprot:CAMPEP_0116830404 /NCGR_PEP_ID=MMETSP0418-20121206/4744_1 /TAXON_ID=1158023 /ORGANISM="Astrosyne radiata, Strain 13vi08-1A" /LENGTH=146 /DNA_ID=CAMNT_0004459503 /DNA_START=255 /DNA_END=695 /DNA_ORIENTATION=+
MSDAFVWALVGCLGAAPLLMYVEQKPLPAACRSLGWGLVVAALVYVGFALVAFETAGAWLGLEMLGVILYGIFFFLSLRSSYLWLSVGWALHPCWDVMLHLWGGGHRFTPEWYVWSCVSFDVMVAIYWVRRVLRSHKDEDRGDQRQ